MFHPTPLSRIQALALLAAAPLAPAALASHTSSAGLGTGLAAIGTETAVPLARGQWSAAVGVEYVDFDPMSDGRLHRLREADPDADLHSADSLLRLSAGLAYGLTEHLTLSLRLPYVSRSDVREPEFEGAGSADALRFQPRHEAGEAPAGAEVVIEALGDSAGLGDLTAFGQYRFYRSADQATHLALLLGMQVPTGKTDERTRAGPKFEAELQPGSGAWNGIVGLAATRLSGAVSIDANILYTYTTEGTQDTELGDIFDYNLALGYALSGSGHRVPGHRHGHRGFAVDGVLELNGAWRTKDRISGYDNRNSGGTLIYLSPGLRLTTPFGVSLALLFGYPLVSDFNGDQDDLDYRVLSNLAYSF